VIDELAVLIRQLDRVRKKNYETILTIINDCLQGASVKNLAFMFGATNQAIENKERGLYSYGALETRLSGNKFSGGGIKDFSGPVLGLDVLSKEELFVLLNRLRDIHANYDQNKWVIPEEGIKAFFDQVFSTMGTQAHLSPRDIIKDYVQLMLVIENNPGKSWKDFINPKDPVAEVHASEGLVNLKKAS